MSSWKRQERSGCYVLSQFNMLYTLCYFENDFCLTFVHGKKLRLVIRNRSSKIELLSIGKKTSFSFARFHGFKNDFALRQLFHCKKQLKKKERKNYNEDTPLDVECA